MNSPELRTNTPRSSPIHAVSLRQARPTDFRKHSDLVNVDKQLAQFFKKTVTINWALILALLLTTSCQDEKEQDKRRLAFGVSCAVSLALNLVPQLLAGWMVKRPTSDDGTNDENVDARDSYRIHALCIVVHICNFSLTVAAVLLEMLLKGHHGFFLFLLLPAGCCVYLCLKTCANGISWAVAQYEEHRADMDFFSGLCSEITQSNFGALSATLFGYMQRTQCKGVQFHVPEIILLSAVVIGLQLMVLCTVPPGLSLPKDREWFIRALKFLTYGLLGLSVLALGVAVIMMCSLYALIPGLLVSVYYLIVFEATGNGIFNLVANMLRPGGAPLSVGTTSTTSHDIELHSAPAHEQPNGPADEQSPLSPANRAASTASLTDRPDKASGEHILHLVNTYSILSGGLMVAYSLGIGAQFKAPVITMYLAVSAYVIQVVAVRELSARKNIVLACRVIAAVLLLSAIIIVTVFFLKQSANLPSSSTSKPDVKEPPRG